MLSTELSQVMPTRLEPTVTGEGKGKGRAASDLLGLQPVLEPHEKVQLLKHFSLSLYLLLNIIRKLREEIIAGDTLHFIY